MPKNANNQPKLATDTLVATGRSARKPTTSAANQSSSAEHLADQPQLIKQPASPVTSPSLSIEQKIAQLDASVEWFYGDDFNLDEALPKYQAAADLATSIEKDLTELKNKVEVLEDFTKN